MQAFGRNQIIFWSALQGVVSDEFATGNGLTASTAPMISNLFPAGANPASTGEVILWGYLCDPMSLLRRIRGTHAMVATLKRPPPCEADQRRPLAASGHRAKSAHGPCHTVHPSKYITVFMKPCTYPSLVGRRRFLTFFQRRKTSNKTTRVIKMAML